MVPYVSLSQAELKQAIFNVYGTGFRNLHAFEHHLDQSPSAWDQDHPIAALPELKSNVYLTDRLTTRLQDRLDNGNLKYFRGKTKQLVGTFTPDLHTVRANLFAEHIAAIHNHEVRQTLAQLLPALDILPTDSTAENEVLSTALDHSGVLKARFKADCPSAQAVSHCQCCGGQRPTYKGRDKEAFVYLNGDAIPSCRLCYLTQHARERELPEMGTLIYCPLLSQPAINALIHLQHGIKVWAADTPQEHLARTLVDLITDCKYALDGMCNITTSYFDFAASIEPLVVSSFFTPAEQTQLNAHFWSDFRWLPHSQTMSKLLGYPPGKGLTP
jgi:hypothetical protein